MSLDIARSFNKRRMVKMIKARVYISERWYVYLRGWLGDEMYYDYLAEDYDKLIDRIAEDFNLPPSFVEECLDSEGTIFYDEETSEFNSYLPADEPDPEDDDDVWQEFIDKYENIITPISLSISTQEIPNTDIDFDAFDPDDLKILIREGVLEVSEYFM
jgi:hypothetical protein